MISALRDDNIGVASKTPSDILAPQRLAAPPETPYILCRLRLRARDSVGSDSGSVLLSLLHTLRFLARSRTSLHLEVLALRHQLAVVNRTRRTRFRLTAADRVLWAWLSKTWRGWRSALHIVQPETVVGCHRRGFRLFWTWKSRRRTGRPGVRAALRALIYELSATKLGIGPYRWPSAGSTQRFSRRHRQYLVGHTTTAELVEHARRGSREASDELVRRHQREAVLLAAAVVGDRAEAEDLGQEALIRALRNLDLLVDPARFAPWLRKIVIGVSIDWLRTFRPGLYRGWDGTDDLAQATGTLSPLDSLLRAELVDRVRSALDALPAKYRVPVRLYHLDGLSHQRIADALALPVGTVRSLAARARRKLAPHLARYQDTLGDPSAAPAALRLLHVANGTRTTRKIEEGRIPGAVSIWADPLHDGPVPGDLDDDRLVAVRQSHLAPLAGSNDPANDLRKWRDVIERHGSYDELILWYEHDLFDQLNLIQLLAWVRHKLPTGKVVSLVCIGAIPGYADFRGLGQLTSDELASLFETRLRIADAQYEVAERAWRAFRSSSPVALNHLLAARG